METTAPLPAILHLLQADLIHYRLLYGLQSIGLTPDDYYLDLHKVIFAHLPFVLNEWEGAALFRRYVQEMEKYMALPLKEYLEMVEEIAVRMHRFLLDKGASQFT